jgi:hypothetical protein
VIGLEQFRIRKNRLKRLSSYPINSIESMETMKPIEHWIDNKKQQGLRAAGIGRTGPARRKTGMIKA